jgi:nucleoside-diphosphate kinase
MSERTLILLKPDCVQRAKAGEIIARFERAGFKIIAMKMLQATERQLEKFYPSTREWLVSVGEKALKNYRVYNLDIKKTLGTRDAYQIGVIMKKRIVEFTAASPVVAMVLEGNHAIDRVRTMVGDTIPLFAPPGTIRGDYSCTSPDEAYSYGSAIHNLIHASGSSKEAAFEIPFWFSPKEIMKYKRCDGEALHG